MIKDFEKHWPKLVKSEARVAAVINIPEFKLLNKEDRKIVLITGKTKTIPFEITNIEDAPIFKPMLTVSNTDMSVLKVEQNGESLTLTALAPGKAILRIFLNDESNMYGVATGDPEEDEPIEISVQVF